LIVVGDGGFEEVAGGFVELVGFESFVREYIFGIVFVDAEAVDGCDVEVAVICFELALKFSIVFHCHRDGCNREDGVETGNVAALAFFDHCLVFRVCLFPFCLEGVEAVAFGLLVEVFEDVARHFGNALGGSHCSLGVDGGDLLVLDVVRHSHGVDEVDSERQNVGVIDGVHDGVCVELITEGLGRRAHRGVAAHSGIDRKNRRAGEAEDVVVLEGFGDFRVHGSELRAMAFVENQDHMLCV